MCMGVGGYAQVCLGVGGSARVCAGVQGYARVCASVWDEFSEFLLENRVPTSADFNTYPIRIFFFVFTISGRKKLAKTGTTPKLQKFRFRLYAFLAKTKKSSTEKSHFFPILMTISHRGGHLEILSI